MKPANRLTVLYAEGGFAQFLKQLEGCLVLCLLWGRDLAVMSEHHKPTGFLPFNSLLEFVPDSDVLSSLGKDSSRGAGISVQEISPKQYELLVGRKAEPYPPMMKFLDFRNLSKGSLYTTGFKLPPGPRFRVATNTFQLSELISQKIYGVISSIAPDAKDFIGVHLRNTDRETNLKAMATKLKTKLQKNGRSPVFLSSDDRGVAESFKGMFPSANFVELNRPFEPEDDAYNLHYCVSDRFALDQLVYALADMYMLSICQTYLPAHNSKTQWTHLVRALRTPSGQQFMEKVGHMASGGLRYKSDPEHGATSSRPENRVT